MHKQLRAVYTAAALLQLYAAELTKLHTIEKASNVLPPHSNVFATQQFSWMHEFGSTPLL
jgi:hypothetical protein